MIGAHSQYVKMDLILSYHHTPFCSKNPFTTRRSASRDEATRTYNGTACAGDANNRCCCSVHDGRKTKEEAVVREK